MCASHEITFLVYRGRTHSVRNSVHLFFERKVPFYPARFNLITNDNKDFWIFDDVGNTKTSYYHYCRIKITITFHLISFGLNGFTFGWIEVRTRLSDESVGQPASQRKFSISSWTISGMNTTRVKENLDIFWSSCCILQRLKTNQLPHANRFFCMSCQCTDASSEFKGSLWLQMCTVFFCAVRDFSFKIR